MVANGGTNIMRGVNLGIDLLNQNQSTVTKKVLVLLSDGEDDNGNYSSDKLKTSTATCTPWALPWTTRT